MSTAGSVVIGAGQGFYGDTPRGALDVARNSDAQYICCDALAELTLAILERDRARDGALGYARDLGDFMTALLPTCRQRGIRLITNAGGANPLSAARRVAQTAVSMGLSSLRIAVVDGADVRSRLAGWAADSDQLSNLDTGAAYSEIAGRVVFATAYLGARPLVEALQRGADVIVCGRVADASLFLAPMVHELGWAWDDWDRLAAGVVAGHVMECSAQSTGGNLSGAWRDVPLAQRIGYPVCRIDADGSFTIGRPRRSGGLVTRDSVRQQLLYEVTDPSAYLNPDVCADMTSLTLTETGDEVRISGVRGARRPDRLKGVLGHLEGFAGVASITYSWPDALAKAERAHAIIEALMADAGLEPLETWTEYLGANGLHGAAAPIADPAALNEVTLRVAARFADAAGATAVARLSVPLALNGPPDIGGGAPPATARPLIGTWPTLLPRAEIEDATSVSVADATELA